MHRTPTGFVPTVLVVDDSQANRDLVRSILEPEFAVVEAADGAAALAAAASHSIDLVLLDVMMPGMTGFDVSRRLRAANRGEYLPILFLTSLTDTADRVAGFEAGADDFITKPINMPELRSRVRAFARTRVLHQERAAMLEDLERLHDLKDDLAALLVHDLRNPLAALTAQLDSLDFDAMDDAARETVGDARTTVRRLQHMVDELLQVRLLEDRARAIDIEPQPIDRVIADAVRTFAPVAQERGVRLVVEAPAGDVLRCDAELLQRAIENLVANAVRHTPAGARVVVRAVTGRDDVRIHVEDEGPGIPREQRPNLFAKYGGRESLRRGRRSGHGLGLYLVGLVMRAHGGMVFIDDAYGAGTRVVMAFPRARDAVAGTA